MAPNKAPKSKKSKKNQKANVDGEEDPIVEYDSIRFLDANAESYHEKNLGKSIHIEKEFDYKSFQLNANFQNRRWGNLCKKPAPAVIPAVREFYANARSIRSSGKSWVRNVDISYEAEDINEVYGIQEVGRARCAYWANVRESYEVMKPLVTNHIATENARWINSGEKPSKLLESYLKPQAKGVHRFVCSRLMPTTHVNEVSWERAVLVYSILAGGEIDVGEIIQEAITEIFTSSRHVGYIFPSLITVLCGKVTWPSEIAKIISKTIINQKRLTSCARDVRGRRDSEEDDNDQVEGEERMSMRKMTQSIYEMLEENAELGDERSDVIKENFKALYTYQKEQFAAIRAFQQERAQIEDKRHEERAQIEDKRHEELVQMERQRFEEQQRQFAQIAHFVQQAGDSSQTCAPHSPCPP